MGVTEQALGFMQTPNGNVVGLYRAGDRHFTRSYVPVSGQNAGEESDITLTPQQAAEYLGIMASCGGVTVPRYSRPLRAAEKETA